MKDFKWILILMLFSYKAYAQQVIKVDCCANIGNKATIITNNSLLAPTPLPASLPSISNVCNFEMHTSANTSAGVYKITGSDTILVRTLWSGVRYDAGCYFVKWDTKLDDGSQAPFGSYLIKVLSNNVSYKWGLIGNSSKSFLNNEEYNAFTDFYDIAISNGNIYYALGYAERDIKTRYAPLNDLGRCIKVQDGINSLSAHNVAVDGTNTYWSGESTANGHRFIFATRQSDGSQVNFTNGTSETMDYGGVTYNSCIGVGSAYIHGLAASSSYIFAVRDDNMLVIYGNPSGSIVSTTSITDPYNIALTSDNKLWTVQTINGSSLATQYTINSNGSLTATGLTLPADEQSGLSVSPVSGELAIVRYSTHQVKIYNGSTGTLNTTLGLAGGYYANGPEVTYNKFDFSSYSTAKFGADGSLWVADNGNRRIMHLSRAGNYIEGISSLGIAYFCSVNSTLPTQVFQGTSSNMEFTVDYTKDLSVSNSNGWKLTNNWKATGNGPSYAPYYQVANFPNGKTYAKTIPGDLFELRPGAGAVFVGNVNGNIEKDGSLWNRNTGPNYNITKRVFTGTTSVGMPIWGSPVVVAVVDGLNVPFSYNNNTLGAASNARKSFFFLPDYDFNNPNIYFHLGSVKNSSNALEWLASPNAPQRYSGPFPPNGYFDQSGHSENCVANIVGANVFWHVNQELGRFTQVAYTNHYNEDGLFIGQFGNDNAKVANTGDLSFLAGNSFVTHAFQIPGSTDIGYIYGDESKHAAVSFVRASNLGSIHEDVIPVTLTGLTTALLPLSNDLMAGLPYASDDQNAIAGSSTKWTVNTRSGATAFQTSIGTFSKDSIDVYCKTYNGNLSVSRYLNNVALNSWTLTGNVSINGNDNNNLEVLDINGKIIARLNAHYSHVYLNEVLTYSDKAPLAKMFNKISYTYSAGSLILNYLGKNTTITSPFENGALLGSPGSLRITQSSGGGDVVIDVYNLKFTAEK